MEEIKNIALVSAAGSGKTHALTKRFLYLFLSKKDYPLESLYAITFTRAAAYEMKSRIVSYLDLLIEGNFTKYKEETRERDVLDYFKKIFSEKELKEIATQKKKYLLNNLSSLNVSTFHSLFASFLSVIPFEAGILPGYKIIEEPEEKIMIENAIDKYLERAHTDIESKNAIYELIQQEERNIRELLSELYENYKPWLSYLGELYRERNRWEKNLSKSTKRLVEAIEEFNNFVEENIELTYTKKGTKSKNWIGFLDKIGQFLVNKNYDALNPLLEYFMKEDGMEKEYFRNFIDGLDDSKKYEAIISQIKKEIPNYLEALSNKELIVHFTPLIEIHKIFQEEKRKKNVITFSDIEDYILKVFKTNPEVDYLYFKLGSDIRHLMIDEFQDTSYKQIDILKPILDEITAYNPEEKSLFYVGDPHQAIFRWRQGAPELFDELQEIYKGKISREPLDTNYRTKVEIINFVNKILNKNDKAKSENIGGWIRIEELGEFNSEEGRNLTANRVVEIIKELKEKGYKDSDIAILTRTNSFAGEIATVLSKNNIPCLSRSQLSIMDEPDVQFIINLLKFLDNPEDDFSLFNVLISDVFNLSEETIRSVKTDNKTLFLALSDTYPEWPVTKKLKELLSLVYFINPFQLIFHICKSLNIEISYPIASLLDGAVSYIKEGCGSLTDFLNWIEQYGPTIESKETQFEGIRIMTIHKAKGLEFEVVIIPETNFWRQKENIIFSYKDRAKPENIYLRKYGKYIPGLEEKEKELLHIDDLNLLYVALTRAKTGVWILGYKPKSVGISWLEIIKEKLGDEKLPYDEISQKEIPKVKKEELEYSVVPAKVSILTEERESYSPTERGIEIIEPARRRGMKFGDIVHKALSKVAWLDNLMVNSIIDDLLKYVKNNFARTSEEIEEIDKRLKSLLQEIFNDPDLRFIFYKDNRNVEFKNELPIYFEDGKKDVSLHIDRVLIEPEKVVVIDYKTGEEKEEYIHQMGVYKKGIEKIYPEKKVTTILVFLEAPTGKKCIKLP
ncbi:MAG: UvrD-helicase domain-containing protein [Endomicrobiia bacterium]